VDIRYVAVDKSGCFPHTFGSFCSDCLYQFETEWREAVDEVVVTPELERCVSVLAVEIVGINIFVNALCEVS
jgi:hypothetical protein